MIILEKENHLVNFKLSNINTYMFSMDYDLGCCIASKEQPVMRWWFFITNFFFVFLEICYICLMNPFQILKVILIRDDHIVWISWMNFDLS